MDFLLNENVASDDPSMVMYKLHGNHTLYVLYYLHGHMHGSLFFIFLNHCLRDIIIHVYSRSQIHNPFEIFNEILLNKPLSNFALSFIYRKLDDSGVDVPVQCGHHHRPLLQVRVEGHDAVRRQSLVCGMSPLSHDSRVVFPAIKHYIKYSHQEGQTFKFC